MKRNANQSGNMNKINKSTVANKKKKINSYDIATIYWDSYRQNIYFFVHLVMFGKVTLEK